MKQSSIDQNSPARTEAYQATQYLLRRVIPPGLYYRMRNLWRQFPLLFLPFSRWRWTRWRQNYCLDPRGAEPAAPEPVVQDTEIVIEGFPRTGNTFTHIAFKMAQGRPIKIGHHTHAAAQIMAAVRMGIPTIVLIRNPEEAIISYLIGEFDPGLTLEQSLREYISFYQSILSYREGFVIATFEQITTDFGYVIRRVNQKFKSSFNEFNHSQENVKKCFELIDSGYQNFFGDLSEKVISRPAESRQVLREELCHQFFSDSPSISKLRNEAQKIYKLLISDSK